MKRLAGLFIVLGIMFGIAVLAGAAELEPIEAVIIGEDGNRENLTGADAIYKRLNVQIETMEMEAKVGYEGFAALKVVFPKDAKKVYLTLKIQGVVPGDELLVYQNGKETMGRVTGEDEITFYFTESGTVEIYKESVKEEAESETEPESETEIAAPVTGPSMLPERAAVCFLAFAVLALMSAWKAYRCKI